MPTIFQEKLDKTLQFKHPAWLGDILIETKGGTEKGEENEVWATLEKLQKNGYRLNKKNVNF